MLVGFLGPSVFNQNLQISSEFAQLNSRTFHEQMPKLLHYNPPAQHQQMQTSLLKDSKGYRSKGIQTPLHFHKKYSNSHKSRNDWRRGQMNIMQNWMQRGEGYGAALNASDDTRALSPCISTASLRETPRLKVNSHQGTVACRQQAQCRFSLHVIRTLEFRLIQLESITSQPPTLGETFDPGRD